jgi:hypothetical protein
MIGKKYKLHHKYKHSVSAHLKITNFWLFLTSMAFHSKVEFQVFGNT